MSSNSNLVRIVSVIASLNAGGIGPVCRYAAEKLSLLTGRKVTLLALHDSVAESVDKKSGLRTICLGLDGNCARLFLDWLDANPQDLIITSGVSRIEPAFPFLPSTTLHVVQIHDSGRRYREVAVRNKKWIDGVICVAQHIEKPLQTSLDAAGFRGMLQTIHNGASFPPARPRLPYDGPLRMLFLGRMDAFKGVFDFVPILRKLKQRGVPISLKLVGGYNNALRRQLQRYDLDTFVNWTGRVTHRQCYDIAADSDLLLLPSRKEPFGMVTIEAMSMGCVPIAYDVVSGSREIIEHEKNGMLVPLGDYEAWAMAIETVHKNRKHLSTLSTAAIERARIHFNSDVMVERMAEFFENMLRHAKDHPPVREAGLPPEMPLTYAPQNRGYQRLPEGLRLWVRNKVGSNPRLCHWLLCR